MIDLNAPIIPFQEAAGIKLYTSAIEMYEYISDWKVKRTARLGSDVLYEIGDDFSFNVNIYNGKICAITVGGNYKGLLWNKIGIGTHIDEVLKIDPSFEYEDFEEFYYNSKGIQIETWADTHKIMSISIGIKEDNWLSKDNTNFEKGNW